MKRNLSFLFTDAICDTIQLINSVNKINERFVSSIVFAFVQIINQMCNSLYEVIYFSNQKSACIFTSGNFNLPKSTRWQQNSSRIPVE